MQLQTDSKIFSCLIIKLFFAALQVNIRVFHFVAFKIFYFHFDKQFLLKDFLVFNKHKNVDSNVFQNVIKVGIIADP